MTVVIFAKTTDLPVDSVVRDLAARDVPVFRVDTSWFPGRLVLEACLEPDGRWTGAMRGEYRTVELGSIRSIWYRTPGEFVFAQGTV